MSPGLKRFKFTDASVVVLEVGPEKKTLIAHKQLLCDSSPFFRAALDGNFREATEAKVKLPEDKVAVVEDFLKWLHIGELEHPKCSNMAEQTPAKLEYDHVFSLYFFAEKIGCSALKKRLVDNIFIVFAHRSKPTFVLPGTGYITRIYKLTTSGSALRRIIVSRFSIVKRKSWNKKGGFGLELSETPEFAADLVAELCLRIEDCRDPFRDGGAEQFYEKEMITTDTGNDDLGSNGEATTKI